MDMIAHHLVHWVKWLHMQLLQVASLVLVCKGPSGE